MKVSFKNLYLAAALVVGISFASCSEDKDEVKPSDDVEIQLPMAPEVDLPMAPVDKDPQ